MHGDPDDLSRAVEALSEFYPRTFFVEGRHRRPLKHNIARDIEADIAKDPESELRFYNIDEAVNYYVDHVGYHKTCSIAGTPRLDLRGERAGTVTEAEARAAGERAEAIFEHIKARKRSNRDQSGSGVGAGAAVVVSVPALRTLRVDTAMTGEELLASAANHLASVRALLGGELVDSTLRKELARSVLLLVIDELKTLDARLTARA
jgi:sRNA-binding protein